MNIAPKARVAIVVALAAVLLTGCSTDKPSTDNSADGVSKTPAATIEQTQPENRLVDVVEVIDPTTIVVAPRSDTDSLYGTKFTVHLNDFSTAAKGECGYKETLAFAKTALAERPWRLDYTSVKDDVWIDAKGDHHGFFNSNGLTYGQKMMSSGLAYRAAGAEYNYLSDTQRSAKEAKTGLWGTCPGFGA